MLRLFRCPYCFVIKGYTQEQMKDFDKFICSNFIVRINGIDEEEETTCLGIMEPLKEHPFFVGQPIYEL